jgi:hypothetical protein
MPKFTHHAISLAMKTKKKKDCADDDGREQNLTDVIVEDFLIGTGSIAGMLFPFGNLLRESRTGWRGYVLFYVHVLTPLAATQSLPCACNLVFWGVSPISRGKGVYNKGSPSLQLFSAIICRLFSTGRWGSCRKISSRSSANERVSGRKVLQQLSLVEQSPVLPQAHEPQW